MSVHVKFNVDLEQGVADGAGRYEDGEGREYRYATQDNGTLAIFEKETDGFLFGDSEPIVVFGPSAWFSVTGDPRTKADLRGGPFGAF